MIFKYKFKKEWLTILFIIIFEVVVIYYRQYYLAYMPIYLLAIRWRLNYTQEIIDGKLSMGTYKEGVSVALASLDHLITYDNKIWGLLGFKYGVTIEGVDYTLTNNLFNDQGRRLADVLMSDYGLPLKKGKVTWGLVKIK